MEAGEPNIYPRDAFRPIARERKYLMDYIFGGRGAGRGGVESVGIHSTGHNECRLLFPANSWFSRDVRKTKIKNFEFLPLSGKSHC